MNIVPYNSYLLVLPNGDTKGFNDLELAKAYINRYYEEKILVYSNKDDYQDVTELVGQVRNNICQQLGVDEGECSVYNIEDFIERVREELIFDEEKEEIISKLLKENIQLNIYEYSLDRLLNDIEKITMIEPFGEV
ncbi:hypothetical protein JCM1393_29400 [Clostridium carnis]